MQHWAHSQCNCFEKQYIKNLIECVKIVCQLHRNRIRSKLKVQWDIFWIIYYYLLGLFLVNIHQMIIQFLHILQCANILILLWENPCLLHWSLIKEPTWNGLKWKFVSMYCFEYSWTKINLCYFQLSFRFFLRYCRAKCNWYSYKKKWVC